MVMVVVVVGGDMVEEGGEGVDHLEGGEDGVEVVVVVVVEGEEGEEVEIVVVVEVVVVTINPNLCMKRGREEGMLQNIQARLAGRRNELHFTGSRD